MAYRDRPIDCPRCRIGLARLDTGERWGCLTCEGMLVGVADVIEQLLVVAPHLAPEGGIGDLSTIGRRAPIDEQIECPICGDAMEPVYLGGVELDRCRHDQVIWFGRREFAKVIDVARGQPRRSWLSRFFGG